MYKQPLPFFSPDESATSGGVFSASPISTSPTPDQSASADHLQSLLRELWAEDNWLDYPLRGSLNLDVQVFDTDCFGVMWHGAYTKWLEMGRVRLLEAYGVKLSRPDEPEGYVYPVAEQRFVFKRPARYGDTLLLLSGLRLAGHKLFFRQCFYNVQSGKSTLESETLNLVVDMQWRLQRRLPKEIIEKLAVYGTST
ncbi:MAG: thioesterase family protein [Vampirovibrionales bacterium]|nr:thioesterase family protein [Vampirovibrionales bacterium]